MRVRTACSASSREGRETAGPFDSVLRNSSMTHLHTHPLMHNAPPGDVKQDTAEILPAPSRWCMGNQLVTRGEDRSMATQSPGIIMYGVTGRMGLNQHL